MKKREPFEDFELKTGASLIAGVDEAGRGCLAGPLAVGMTIFTADFFRSGIPENLTDIDDSKKLSPLKREGLIDSIKSNSVFSCVIHVSSKIIDTIGINPATEFAIIRALRRAHISGIKPGHLFLDGNFKFKNILKNFPELKYESIKGGDSKVFSIAAASILAKVTRDRRMERYNSLYPGYFLDKHKGYGTLIHRECIKKIGPSPIHRTSYILK